MQPIDTPVNAFDRFLTQLADRRIFIVARNGNRARWGDGIKAPIDPATGNPSDAQDPATWMLPHEAQALALLDPDWILGVVLGYGLACLDQDHVRSTSGAWDASVDELFKQFPDAYRETSQGGDGKHIILAVNSAQVIPHGTRNRELHLEAYHELRYIALTGRDAEGALTEYTYNFNALLKEYFPPTSRSSSVEWSDEPTHPDYKATLTDDELIAVALASQLLKAFTGEPRFKDLWTANVDVLSKRWPDSGSGSYDESSADLALAGQLAFYTGCNHGRIYRLMCCSALNRSKWERDEYIRGTISKAVASALTRATYAPARSVVVVAPQRTPPAQNADGLVPPAPTTPPVAVSMGAWIGAEAQRKLFESCVYVGDIHMAYVPNLIEPLDKQRFEVQFPGTYIMSIAGEKSTQSAWECFTRTTMWQPLKVWRSYFDPREPHLTVRPNHRDGQLEVNTCKRPPVRMMDGDATPFVNHVRTLLPGGDDAVILISYMAGLVQYPGIKARWCPFLQSMAGAGKSLIGDTLKYALGVTMCKSANSGQLANHFNDWLCDTLLVVFNEIKVDHDRADAWETLKTYITDIEQQIEGKNLKQVQRDILANFFLCSNHKDALPKTVDERRLAMLYCAQQIDGPPLEAYGLTGDYFERLFGWLEANGKGKLDGDGYAIVANYLRTYSIPAAYDFTKRAIVAPCTTSSAAAIEESRSAPEQEIVAAVAEGLKGFRRACTSSTAVEHLLRARLPSMPSLRKRGAMMAAIGYRIHPSLATNEGRLFNPLPDGSRPVVYFQKDHPGLTQPWTSKEVGEAYWQAQQDA